MHAAYGNQQQKLEERHITTRLHSRKPLFYFLLSQTSSLVSLLLLLLTPHPCRIKRKKKNRSVPVFPLLLQRSQNSRESGRGNTPFCNIQLSPDMALTVIH